MPGFGRRTPPVDLLLVGRHRLDDYHSPRPRCSRRSTFDLTPEFRWTAVAGARRYQIVVEDLITQTAVIRETVIGLTAYTPVANLAVGLYRWRVRAEGDNGIIGDWSPSSQVFAGGRPNYNGPTGEVKTGKPVFSWQAVEGAASYSIFLQRQIPRDRHSVDRHFSHPVHPGQRACGGQIPVLGAGCEWEWNTESVEHGPDLHVNI